MLNAPFRKISRSKIKGTQWIIPESKLDEILEATKEAIPNLDIEKTGQVLSLDDIADKTQKWKLIVAKNEVTGKIETYILDPKRSLGKGGEGEVVLAQNIETAE